jgi:imidazolonepropionase-like amidohydrolase
LSKKFDYSTYTYRTSPNKDYGKEVNELKAFFTAAMSYGQMKDKESNLKLSAMSGLFDGSKRLFLHAGSEKEIIESVSCLKEMGIEHVVLYSGASTWTVKDFLIEKSIPVILKSPHTLPEHEDQSNEIPYQLAVDLTKAGLKVALSHNGMLASGRNLPFYAGTSAAYGLDKEAALQLITLNTATLLGIDQQVGSLEVGKNATLFVSSGDALDMMSNDLTSAYIDGKKIVLNSTQQALAEKYKAKYGQE